MALLKPKIDRKNKKEKLSRQEKNQIKKDKKEQLKSKKAKDNLLKKEANKREQKRIENENKPLTWVYSGEADITIGETKVSNAAKIALIFLLAGLLAAGIFGFLNKNLVVDYITKPAIVLTDKEVSLDVGEPFNYKEYLAEQEYPDRYKLTLPKNSDVDTTKVGTYTVKYKLKSLSGTTTTELKVNVVDKTPPTLELKETLLKLTRGDETKKFNPKKYIKNYSDNYDKKENLKVDYTKKFDWSKDKVEVKYTVKDSSNNTTAKKLLISVSDPVKETQPTTSSSNSNSNSSSGNNYSSSNNSSGGSSSNSGNSSGSNSSGGSSNSDSGGSSSGGNSSGGSSSNSGSSSSGSSGGSSNSDSGGSSSGGNSSGGSSSGGSSSSSPYISGVHSISVPVGSDFSSMVNKLTSGVQGSGYVTCNYSNVNLTQEGNYTVTFSSSDGVTKTATVTVY